MCFEYDMVTEVNFKEKRKWPGLHVCSFVCSVFFPLCNIKKYCRTFSFFEKGIVQCLNVSCKVKLLSLDLRSVDLG